MNPPADSRGSHRKLNKIDVVKMAIDKRVSRNGALFLFLSMIFLRKLYINMEKLYQNMIK